MKCYNCKSENVKVLYNLKNYKVVKCENCGLRFSWPPEKHNYEEDYFKEEQKQYFETQEGKESKIRLFKEWLKEIEIFKKRGRILDVGCATGTFLELCKNKGWKCYGIDVSKYASEYVKKKLNIETKTGELTKAGYEKDFFDLVFMSFIIEHTSNPVDVLKETRRILKKEGMLFVSTINEDSLLNLFADFIYKLSFGIIKKPVELLHAHQHLTHFSEKDLIKMLEKTGFKILKTRKMDLSSENFSGSFVKDIVLTFFYFFQRILGKQYIVWVIAGK